MKRNSPKALSLLLASFFSVLFIVFLIADYFSQSIVLRICMLVVFFITTYFNLKLYLKKFIYDRIKPIYKTIHQVNLMGDDDLENEVLKRDVIGDVQSKVKMWADEKEEEIEKLKGQEKYRRDFLGNVSHELKTPIFNMQGYILTLLEDGINDPRINKLYLERTEKSINRMINIVEDLEAITKLESGELKLKLETFDIIRLVEDVFENEQPLADKRQITLQFREKYDEQILVYADKKRMFEAIRNLVSNSIKYGKKGGIVQTAFFDMDDYIMVEVKDNGVGIDPESLPRIFERFYRVDKSRSRQQGGTGLGLAIVKHIIEAHKQTIQVKSEPNKGTSFTFALRNAEVNQ